MTSLWPYDSCTPYDILGVSPSAGVAEIRQSFKRMALQTHPDKRIVRWNSDIANGQSQKDRADTMTSSGTPFYLVKEAVEVLLDPFLRHQYDQLQCQTMLRSVGASSETCNLSEDFIWVSSLGGSSFGGGWADIYQRECRCGGTYEITRLRFGSTKGGCDKVRTRSCIMNFVLLFKAAKPMYRCAILMYISSSLSMTEVQPFQNYSNFPIKKRVSASLVSVPKTVYCLRRSRILTPEWQSGCAANASYRPFCRGVGSIAHVQEEREDSNAVHDVASERGNQASCRGESNCAEDSHQKEEEEEEENQDAAMAAYEEFLLSMSEGSSALCDSALTPSTVTEPVEAGVGKVTVTKAVETIISEAETLLPEDGRSMRLTDLTPLLDVEAINDLSGGGSVLSFFQSFPDIFTLTASDAKEISGGSLGVSRARRWYVGRSKPIKSSLGTTLPADSSSCTLAMKPGDLVDLYAEEELRALTQSTSSAGASAYKRGQLSTSTASSRLSKCGQRRALRPVSDTAGRHASISTLDWYLLSAALPSRPLPVPQVMQEIAPEEFSRQVRLSGKGLIRLFHEQYEVAKHHVMLSAENSLIARAGELSDALAWAPDVATTQLAQDSDPDESSCDGDFILDEEEEVLVNDSFVEDDADVATEMGQDGVAWGTTAVHWPSVFYGGLSTPRKKSPSTSRTGVSMKTKKPTQSPKVPAIRPSTPAGTSTESTSLVSKLDKTHTGSPEKKRTAVQRGSSEGCRPSRQELQEAHTELAIQRGWRTPLEMLDFFVECIPTFFVPVPELVPTDSLAKILGPRNTISHVVKVYSYFFEHDKDKNHARLAPTLQHPRMGEANIHYNRWDPLSLTGAHDTACKSTSKRLTRPCGLTLQSTAATSSFPILKPIIRSVRSDLNQSSSMVKNKPIANTTQESTTNLSLALHRASRSSIFSAVESTDHSQPLHTLLRMICKVPYEKFVSLAEAAEQAEITFAELEAEILADKDISANSRAHQHLFLTVSLPEHDGGMMVRLRPYWLAPNSLGELGVEDLPVEVSETLRPTWTPIPKLLSKFSEDSRAQLMQLARNYQINSGDINCGGNDDGDNSQLIVRSLRLAGHCCWVDADGKKVRRYTTNADLDDFAHISIHLLRHFASTVFEPVDVVLDRAEASLSALSHTEKEMKRVRGGVTAICRHAVQTRRHEFVEFLQFHKRVLEVRTADEDRSLCLRRKTSFVSFDSRP